MEQLQSRDKLMERKETALQIDSLRTGYGNKIVVHDVSIAVEWGKITALLGHNGAGKTTTLKSVAGLLPAYHGAILLENQNITHWKPSARVRAGVAYVPQERAVFGQMSVRDNLLLGATLVRDATQTQRRLEMVLSLFPILRERLGQPAGTLSGGQQRMVSVGIALMAGARILLLDEPSLGLAPSVSQTLLTTIKQQVEADRLAVLLVEQAVSLALEVADHIYVMRSGQIVADEPRHAALGREHWWELF